MTLRFQPARLMTPVLFVLVLIAFSYWFNPQPWRHLTLSTELLFAFALVTFAGLMIAMRTRSHLRLDERGLEIQYLWGAPRLCAWPDIESARIFKKRMLMVPVLSTIRLQLRPGARSTNSIQRAFGGLVGDVSFLAVYDESAEQILEKIEMFRRNHGGTILS